MKRSSSCVKDQVSYLTSANVFLFFHLCCVAPVVNRTSHDDSLTTSEPVHFNGFSVHDGVPSV